LLCGINEARIESLGDPAASQTLKFNGVSNQLPCISPDWRLLGRIARGNAEIWDLESGANLAKVSVGGLPGGLAISSDSQRLYCAADTSVLACDSRSGQELYRLQGHSLAITHLALSGDGKQLVSASNWNQSIRLWRLPD
jgi:WD40 repeat protein